MSASKKCSCGTEIRFGRDVDSGKILPLDFTYSAYTYDVEEDESGELHLRKIGRTAISHFRTCPHARRYSQAAQRDS